MSDAHDRLAGLDSTRLARLAEANKVAAYEPAPLERPADAPKLPAGYVTHAAGVGYFVQSRTTEGVWYLVHGATCSCAAGQSGHERCWHRAQVAAFVSRLNREQARPVAPVNRAALCD
jgi:hypothetical protein